MTQTPPEPFQKLMFRMSDFYRVKLTATDVITYYEAIGNHPIDRLESAYRKHVSDPACGRFMPRPADLMKHLQDDFTPISRHAGSSTRARALHGQRSHRSRARSPQQREPLPQATRTTPRMDRLQVVRARRHARRGFPCVTHVLP